MLSLGLDNSKKPSDPLLLSLGVQHHAQPVKPVRNTNLNEISGAVHVDSEQELRNSTFPLKRTRSLRVFDDCISPVKDLAGNYENYPYLKTSDELKETAQPQPRHPVAPTVLAAETTELTNSSSHSEFTHSQATSISSSSSRSSSHSLSHPEYTDHSDSSPPGTPELTAASDDSVLHYEPQRHVDYLSHDWKESDISSSWRYIVLRRKDVANSARLENASWRTWTKAKYNLKTVAPETVNWLKDYDVTWLYGPLYTEPQQHSDFYRSREAEDAGRNRGPTLGTPPAKPSSPISPITTSSLSTKPILKKKSAAETILSRPSLLTNGKRHSYQSHHHPEDPDHEGLSMYMRLHNYRHHPTGESTEDISSYVNKQYVSAITSPPQATVTSSPSVQLSDTASVPSFASLTIPPASATKHIHFNNRVEQCIAVEEYEEDRVGSDNSDTDKDDYSEDGGDYSEDDDEEEDEEAGLFLMVRSHSSTSLYNRGLNGLTSRDNLQRTIALLPATTLKYEIDTTEREAREAAEASSVAYAMSHNTANRRQVYKTYDYNSVYTSPQLSPSHSPSSSMWESPSQGCVTSTVSPPLSTKSSSTNQTTNAIVKGEMVPKTLGSPTASSVLLGSNASKSEDSRKIKDLSQSLWTNGWKR